MEKIINAVVKWLAEHLSPKYMFAIAIISAGLLFLPERVIAYFALDVIAKTYRGWISLAFFGSVVLLVAHVGSWGWDAGMRALARRGDKRHVEGLLNTLGNDEIVILQQYFQSGRSSIHFSPTNGSVHSLVDKRILYRPGQQMMGDGTLAYNLTTAAAPRVLRGEFKTSRD